MFTLANKIIHSKPQNVDLTEGLIKADLELLVVGFCKVLF